MTLAPGRAESTDVPTFSFPEHLMEFTKYGPRKPLGDCIPAQASLQLNLLTWDLCLTLHRLSFDL